MHFFLFYTVIVERRKLLSERDASAPRQSQMGDFAAHSLDLNPEDTEVLQHGTF